MKKFDLNIEKVLQDWETYHAVREVIANALDEQLLTKTKDIEIVQDRQKFWHIRDFGRGLKYEHLTQKENEEKVRHPDWQRPEWCAGHLKRVREISNQQPSWQNRLAH